jgi:hypothetical protein
MSVIDREFSDSADGICPICGKRYKLTFPEISDLPGDDQYEWSRGLDGLRPVARLPDHWVMGRLCQGSGKKPERVILDGE